MIKEFIMRHKHIYTVALIFRRLQKEIYLYLLTSKNLKKVGLIDSVVGSFDETKRKAVSDFIGEEFKEDRKAIEFINKK